jgi:hypothetical protein
MYLRKVCALLSIFANVKLFDCNEKDLRVVGFFQMNVNLFLSELSRRRDITPHK